MKRKPKSYLPLFLAGAFSLPPIFPALKQDLLSQELTAPFRTNQEQELLSKESESHYEEFAPHDNFNTNETTYATSGIGESWIFGSDISEL